MKRLPHETDDTYFMRAPEPAPLPGRIHWADHTVDYKPKGDATLADVATRHEELMRAALKAVQLLEQIEPRGMSGMDRARLTMAHGALKKQMK